MTDSNPPPQNPQPTAQPGPPQWPGSSYPTPPPQPPLAPPTAATQGSWSPQPPPQFGPPPSQSFNPTRVAGSRPAYGWRTYGGGRRGSGVYSIIAGAISILVVLGSLAINGNGHFVFLIFLPVLGLIYGIATIVQRAGTPRVLGIIGTALCAVALLAEAYLFFG